MKEEVMEEARTCSRCGCVIEDERFVEFDGEVLCADCAAEHTAVCSQCGERIWVDDANYFDDETLCDDCFDECTVVCDHCGDRVWATNVVSDSEISLCDYCFDHSYYRCDVCGRLVRCEDALFHSGDCYCEECYENVRDDVIHDYCYKPDPIFYGEGPRFFGVELEVDGEGEDNDNAREIVEIANEDGKERIYCKHDGSLDDGFEIVTHPMELDYHLKIMPWRDITRKATEMGYRSHQTSTCGLHIHVSRAAFGESHEEQEEVIERILLFVELHWAELLKFSRRTQYSIDRWAARYGMEKTGKEILDKAKKSGNGRYTAVNLCNYSTIEFRLFRGTLKLNTLFATLQLVNRIIDIAMYNSEGYIMAQSWTDFVADVTEPELIQYLKERRLYVNEEVVGEEDV